MDRIEEWEWDEGNLSHCARHEVTPRVVAEVSGRKPLFRANLEGRTATYQMVGPDEAGRWWTICLVIVREGRGRVITGWPATKNERIWWTEHEAE